MHTAPAQQEFASSRPVHNVVYGPSLIKLARRPPSLPRSLLPLATHLNQVHLCKALKVSRTNHVEDGDDVLVLKVPQQLDLAQRAQAEHAVVKGRDALDRHARLGGVVNR